MKNNIYKRWSYTETHQHQTLSASKLTIARVSTMDAANVTAPSRCAGLPVRATKAKLNGLP